MKQLAILFFFLLTCSTFGQDKYSYVSYNKLTELKGTDYMMATVENWEKMATNSQHLLFINTRDGSSRQIDFPGDAYIGKIEQVKIDSLGINKVVVVAKTVNLDQSKSIDWSDPQQIIVLSTDGQEKTQLTEDRFFVSTWSVHRQTGSIVITGHYDSNNNGKYDKTDRNEIIVYNLRNMKLVTKI